MPADVKETPSFRRHVVPLLGKLGCNGRACHGSFQGRGGFRLSLFGYDFKMDHQQLLAGQEPRVNPKNPDASLILQKPTMRIPHEGGLRYKLGSWEHHVLLRWIQGGAIGVKDSDPNFVRLVVTPAELRFAKKGEHVALKAVAQWSDGTNEDVTPLCRYQSNDEQISKIDANGNVTSGEPGDSHVVVFYDTGVVPVPVMRPVSDVVGPRYPDVPAPTEIDRLVVKKLKKMGIVPSELCTDTEFLRRASLDVTGTLPTAKEVAAFVADKSPDKRRRKVDELLARPTYAAWWTTRICDITGNNDQALNNVTLVDQSASQEWYDWVLKRVQANMPYDKIVENIVLGEEPPGESVVYRLCRGNDRSVSKDGQSASSGPAIRRPSRPDAFLGTAKYHAAAAKGTQLRLHVPGNPHPMRGVPQASVRPVDAGRLQGIHQVLRSGPLRRRSGRPAAVPNALMSRHSRSKQKDGRRPS